MKIKMIRHYHGKLSNKEHFPAGSEQTVSNEVGKALVDRGFAEQTIAEEVKPPAPKKADK